MTKIQNLAGEEYRIGDVVLGAGRAMEMEDAMAERFLVEFKGQVEVAGEEKPEEEKVKRGRKPKTK